LHEPGVLHPREGSSENLSNKKLTKLQLNRFALINYTNWEED